MSLTREKVRQGSASHHWISSLLSPRCLGSLLLVWLLSPQGAEAGTEQGQGCRQQQIPVYYWGCGACLVSTLWTCQSKQGHVRASLPLQLSQHRFSAIIYFASSQSQTCLWKIWCLFRSLLSKCELWGLIILLGHQWNFFICVQWEYVQVANMRVKKKLSYVSTETKSSIFLSKIDYVKKFLTRPSLSLWLLEQELTVDRGNWCQ